MNTSGSTKGIADALRDLMRAYVGTLENARDRIIFLGGDCDSLDKMVSGDPALRAAREALEQPDEPVDDEQWQRSMEDAVRFRFFFDPHRGETSKAILGLTMKALTPPYPSVDAWRAAIDADRLGLTKGEKQ